MEAFIEVVTPDTKEQCNEVLNALRDDRAKSRTMRPDGSYVRETSPVSAANGRGGAASAATERAWESSDSQERLYRYFSGRRVTLPVSEAGGKGGRAPAGTEKAREGAPDAETFWQRLKRALGG